MLWKQVSNIFSIAYLFFGFDVGFSKFSTKYSKLVENSGKTLKFDGEKNSYVLKKNSLTPMKTTFPQFDFDSFRQRVNKSWYLLRKLCFSMMKKFLTFVFSQVKRNKLSVSPGGKNKRAKRYSLFFQSVEKRFTWGFASFSSLFSEFSQFSTISFNLFQKFSQIWKKLVEKFFFSGISMKEKMLKNAFSPSGTRKIMIREILKTW